MKMSESSLKRLRTLQGHVRQSVRAIKADELFRLVDGQEKPEWNDLKRVIDILDCREQRYYAQYTYMWTVAGALEATMVAFTGRETLPDLRHVKRYLLNVLEKTTGKYEFEHRANALFFLSRFRTKLTNRIAAVQKVLQKEKKI